MKWVTENRKYVCSDMHIDFSGRKHVTEWHDSFHA
jgi:hypothetical protein